MTIITELENSNPVHVNRLRGVLGSASGWDVSPTSLANCTDGDFSTVTGTGNKNMGAAGDYGIIVFDMGTIYTVLVGARIGVWAASTRSVGVFIEGSDDNATWRGYANRISAVNTQLWATSSPNTEELADAVATLINARYIRMRFYVNGASNTAQAKIYEIYALDMGSI